jgi:hypothetical protein
MGPATVWQPSYASACSPPKQAQASQDTGMQHKAHSAHPDGPDRVQDTREIYLICHLALLLLQSGNGHDTGCHSLAREQPGVRQTAAR